MPEYLGPQYAGLAQFKNIKSPRVEGRSGGAEDCNCRNEMVKFGSDTQKTNIINKKLKASFGHNNTSEIISFHGRCMPDTNMQCNCDQLN